MQLAALRKEQCATAEQARRDQDLAAAKRWIHETWPGDDWQDVVHAIRDSVNAECLLRDNREHGIPFSGKLYEDEPARDPATGVQRLPSIKVDPRRKGLRHGGKEVRLEARRRTYALAVLRPEPSAFFDLLRAVIEDDGKDAEGRWLCNRCVPESDEQSEAFPDGSGFDGRLPKWMPVTVGQEPAEPVGSAIIAAARSAGCSPPGFQPTDGCSECGGAKYGKGFRHADGCSKSTKRVKAPA